MRIQKAFGIFLAMCASCPIYGHTQALDNLGRPAWMSSPKPALTSDNDTVDTNVRLKRSHHFNSPPGQAALSGDLTNPRQEGTGSSAFYDQSLPNGIPSSISDVILTGTTTGFQPFLSDDHTHIYSELSFQPSEVFKGTKFISTQPPYLTIVQSGGSLQLANGKSIFSPPFGGTYPLKLGASYLLFLRYELDLKAYKVIAAWDISHSTPLELDGDGHIYKDPNRLLEQQTTTVSSLLDLVRRKLSQ